MGTLSAEPGAALEPAHGTRVAAKTSAFGKARSAWFALGYTWDGFPRRWKVIDMKHAHAIRALLGVGFAITLALLGAAGTAHAGSGLGEAIVQPQHDDIELSREGIEHVEDQGRVRLAEMEAWLAYHQKQFAAVDAKCQNLVKTWDETMAKVKKAKGALGSLLLSHGKGYVPHYGWHTVESLQKHIEALQKQYEDVKEKITNGDLRVHVQIIGWVTRKELQARVEGQQTALGAFRALVVGGTFRAHVPGIGWATVQELENRITANEAKIEATTSQIAAGEFRVHIPTIGWTTRLELEQGIKGVENAIEALEASFGDGKARIHRPLLAWMSRIDFERSIKGMEKEYAAYEKHIKTSVWQAHFPSGGWLTGAQIEARIKGLETRVGSIHASVSKGTYAVPVEFFGTINRQQMQKALAALAKQKDVQDKVTALQKGLAAIATTSGVDAAIYVLDKSMYTSWIAEILRFARPWLEAKNLGLTQIKAHRGDWDAELKTLLGQKTRQLEHLRRCLAFLP